MDMFQDSMPFVIENLLDTVTYLKGGGTCLCTKIKENVLFWSLHLK
jgi:hypothetical protein